MSPRVFLVTRPQFDVDSFLRFVTGCDSSWKRTAGATQAEEIVESAGRVCYLSFGPRQSHRTNAEYIANLVKMGHESVLEHVNWGFVLEGISRSFSHQLVRHRAGWAFSQLSQQYHDENDATFLMPTNLEHSPAALSSWQRATETALSAYREILASLDVQTADANPEEKRELRRAVYSAARSVLPNATETIIFATANARAIRHFLTVRSGLLGDEEMRSVSAALLAALQPEAPALFADFEVKVLSDGLPIVVRLDRGTN